MDVVTGEYFHGGLGVYPSNGLEHLAVLKTDNTYDNSCLHLFIDAQPRFYTTMDANLGVNFTSGLNIQQSTVIVVDNSIAAVDEYFCELTPLKPQVEEIIAYHSENGIRIQELDVESEYSIFSMTGSRIDEGKVYPNETISLNHLPKGVYLLKIKNQFLKIQN
ncbi:MAG: T9SS type A sorting domain-containing protein [Bacteroidota bacterium]|nr:MAG: T9SS type A sorting domain-containing protein [Bacteroidota bacterium]